MNFRSISAAGLSQYNLKDIAHLEIRNETKQKNATWRTNASDYVTTVSRNLGIATSNFSRGVTNLLFKGADTNSGDNFKVEEVAMFLKSDQELWDGFCRKLKDSMVVTNFAATEVLNMYLHDNEEEIKIRYVKYLADKERKKRAAEKMKMVKPRRNSCMERPLTKAMQKTMNVRPCPTTVDLNRYSASQEPNHDLMNDTNNSQCTQVAVQIHTGKKNASSMNIFQSFRKSTQSHELNSKDKQIPPMKESILSHVSAALKPKKKEHELRRNSEGKVLDITKQLKKLCSRNKEQEVKHFADLSLEVLAHYKARTTKQNDVSCQSKRYQEYQMVPEDVKKMDDYLGSELITGWGYDSSSNDSTCSENDNTADDTQTLSDHNSKYKQDQKYQRMMNGAVNQKNTLGSELITGWGNDSSSCSSMWSSSEIETKYNDS